MGKTQAGTRDKRWSIELLDDMFGVGIVLAVGGMIAACFGCYGAGGTMVVVGAVGMAFAIWKL